MNFCVVIGVNKQTHNLQTMRTIAVSGIAVATIGLWILLSHSYPSGLMINEISFSNNGGEDWIEIYNLIG